MPAYDEMTSALLQKDIVLGTAPSDLHAPADEFHHARDVVSARPWPLIPNPVATVGKGRNFALDWWVLTELVASRRRREKLPTDRQSATSGLTY